MTEPSDEVLLAAAADGERNYASDRHLLLQEIQSLAKEVGRLRGDTKHLNDVVIPKEEHYRRRKVNSILVGFTLLLFSLAGMGLYVQGERLTRTQEQVQRVSFEECVAEKEAAQRNVAAVIEVNALLGDLRTARASLANSPEVSAVVKKAVAKEVAAYDRYLDFVATFAARSQAEPATGEPNCEQYLK